MNPLGHLRVDQMALAPAQEWTDESNAWRFLRIRSGAAYWLGSGQLRALNSGEVILAAPNARSLIRASQLNEVVFFGFAFLPDLLCGFFSLAERHLLEQQAAIHPVSFLPSTHPLAVTFRDLTDTDTPQQGLSRKVEVLGIIAAFFDETMPQNRKTPRRAISADERFRDVVSQMPDLELIQRTPGELAELCRCSSRHFNRLFKAFFGESPRVRQTKLRLLKAGQLLANTNEKVTEVARDTGFRSVSLFNSLFKRRFGLSPSEFRNNSERNASKEPGI